MVHTTPNNKWHITRVRSAFPGHFSGYLQDLQRDKLYVWNCINGRLEVMALPKLATDVPAYVRDILQAFGNPEA